jgi:hypothetical protein
VFAEHVFYGHVFYGHGENQIVRERYLGAMSVSRGTNQNKVAPNKLISVMCLSAISCEPTV